jgi:flagellum-specific peptidoglycan hydrolase FlgJ
VTREAITLGAAALVALAAKRGQIEASWTDSMRAAVASVLPDLSAAARDLVVAHAAFESGFGAARAAQTGNNVFNLTAGSAWSGPTFTDQGGDTQYDAQGNYVGRITQVWRVYASLEECVGDYWEFLGPWANRGRYVQARAALERADLPAFCNELHRAGYFTLPAQRYQERLEAVLAKVTT